MSPETAPNVPNDLEMPLIDTTCNATDTDRLSGRVQEVMAENRQLTTEVHRLRNILEANGLSPSQDDATYMASRSMSLDWNHYRARSKTRSTNESTATVPIIQS